MSGIQPEQSARAANGGQPHELGAHERNAKGDKELAYEKSKERTAWVIYNSEAKRFDKEKVTGWTTSLNSLLVFVSAELYF